MKKPLTFILVFILSVVFNACQPFSRKYQTIVDYLKTMPLEKNKLLTFKAEPLTGEAKITALKEVPARGEGKGQIWVYKTDTDFWVFIETEDNGHAGEYGVAYSESGKVPAWKHDDWGERWTIDKKLDQNWWAVSYRLD